ncbi:phosphatidate cytidylyltransferase [Alteribacillus iranensis]|uniref:Phosphatidate cytidylyltransferase n=1 Tax=Alteribacillus iranensis TaxID=930128 RepID=A0A1I2A2S6_9BACI|nr:phosphatidate cytidylyltransferase [Alteribacillus iranensis]SFE38434.1 phosphatidate cytidylyltransferase [Alteribacillus iranensis]
MKDRVITGVVGGLLLLGSVIAGGMIFMLVFLIIGTIAMYELLKMKQIRPYSLPGAISFLFMWFLFIPSTWGNITFFSHVSREEIFLFMIFFLLALTVITKNTFTFDEAGFVILSSVYVGFGFHHVLLARDSEEGLILVLYILFTIWATDSGAFLVGKNWGKRKLWEAISPKKTVEGFFGGIGMALIVGVIMHLFFPLFDSIVILIAFLLVVSIFGQFGDLVESALKRRYIVKDSGNLLPGHGGMLDRFDSLIFVMPILYFLQLY